MKLRHFKRRRSTRRIWTCPTGLAGGTWVLDMSAPEQDDGESIIIRSDGCRFVRSDPPKKSMPRFGRRPPKPQWFGSVVLGDDGVHNTY